MITRGAFRLAKLITYDAYLKGCAEMARPLKKSIRKTVFRLASVCWNHADLKYGNLRQYKGKNPDKELPKEALTALVLVRDKATELFCNFVV